MRLAAVVCTYGRESLAQLLACVERQTVQLPTLVWVDNAPHVKVLAPDSVELHHGPRMRTIGAVRAAAVAAARERFELRALDGFMLLDDDDFYSSQHFERTRAALIAAGDAGWTGGLSIGISRGSAPIEHVCHDSGIGQHATWAVRLDVYDRAGGYPDARTEDIGLAHAIGFEKCRPHWHTTHVRRYHDAHLSGVPDFDCDALRSVDRTIARGAIVPRWTPECESLERWCAAIQPPRRAVR